MPTPVQPRYTGLWARQQAQAYEDPDRFTVEPPPDPGHAYDPSAPPEPVVQQQAPVLPGGGEIVTDVTIEEVAGRPPSDPIDHTPAEGDGHAGHDSPPGGNHRLSATPPTLALLRGVDMGAVRREVGQLGRPFQYPSEQYFGVAVDGSQAPPMTQGPGDLLLRRGVNAYPSNNESGGRMRPSGPGRTPAGQEGRGSWRGSGWRAGRYQPLVTNVQRHFKVPNRTHRRFRVLQPDVITYVGDAPPPDVDSRYSSPFTKLQRFGLNVGRTRRPGMRRSPGPWDDAQVAAAPTVSAGVPVDGLVVP